ncbi:MAG: radical SAM protein [Fibrobacter sp.]|nr:radical SAM protein [Fibrobacter sp.]
MHYQNPIIRPPSEANSILLQVTTGCSHNRCAFCGIYKDIPFRIKEYVVILDDLRFAKTNFRNLERVFLCDGDALIIPQKRLVQILTDIRTHLPWTTRTGTYANAKSIARKSLDELRELRNFGLRIVHMGLESGDDETLRRMGKWGDSSMIVEQGIKLKEAGINLFVTVISGLAGKERSSIHARSTGIALTRMNPQYVGALSLMPVENSLLYNWISSGLFKELTPREHLQEIRMMFENTDLNPGYFYANHASNYLPLRIRLPRDKEAALTTIDAALRGELNLTPEWLRGL